METLIICVLATFVKSAPFDVSINCVPLNQCPELHNLATAYRDSVETIKLLRRSHCGYIRGGQPKVWCSSVVSLECKIPNGRLGTCTEYDQCEVLTGLITHENELADLQAYINHAKCNQLNERFVCCPSKKSNLQVVPVSSNQNVLPNPENRECGIQDVPKIFGGKVTQFEEFPWTVQLQYNHESQLSINCGGTLISNRYVLTAAHCVDKVALRSVGQLVNVVLGEFDTRNATDCIDMLGIIYCADAPLVVPVESVIIHPEWSIKPAATIDHDIALIRLTQSVKFTEYIRPICLPSSSTVIKEGQQLIVVGWGQTETGLSSPIKLKATVPVANKVQCIGTYKSNKRLTVGNGEFCVGGEDGIDSCTGDSGGPLMYQDDTAGESLWYLAGVVSFGPNEPCGVRNYPGLYTHVPNYVQWIHNTVQK
ncbi:hypothetical protein FQA39_LY01679 [Lamprigera yunnana]|nr:hypothetical protein FQA39_LY01679 [Lamprigera yunnana]